MAYTTEEAVELVKSFEELTRAWPLGISLFSIQGQGKVLVVADADGEILKNISCICLNSVQIKKRNGKEYIY